MERRAIVGQLHRRIGADRPASQENWLHTGQHCPEDSSRITGFEDGLQPIVLRVGRTDIGHELDGLAEGAVNDWLPGFSKVLSENVQVCFASVQILIELHHFIREGPEWVMEPKPPNAPVEDVLRTIVDE